MLASTAHMGDLHAPAVPGPWVCRESHLQRVFSSPTCCAYRTRHTGGRWHEDAGSGAAECDPTGLQRGLSRWAGFLERLEPAPAPAASREVLPALAGPSVPGARSWPRATVQLGRVSGQAQPVAWETPALALAPCSAPPLCPFPGARCPMALARAAPSLLEGPPQPVLMNGGTPLATPILLTQSPSGDVPSCCSRPRSSSTGGCGGQGTSCCPWVLQKSQGGVKELGTTRTARRGVQGAVEGHLGISGSRGMQDMPGCQQGME